MANVYYSVDAGTTWTELTIADPWPTSAGIHKVRFNIPDQLGAVVNRMQFKVASTDDDAWGIRSMQIFIHTHPQIGPRGA